MGSFIFKIGPLALVRNKDASYFGYRLLFWRFWWRDRAFWQEQVERNRRDEQARYYRWATTRLPELHCPKGHPMYLDWNTGPSGEPYYDAGCAICLQLWRIYVRPDGSLDWRVVVLPDPDGDKPIDVPPIKME